MSDPRRRVLVVEDDDALLLGLEENLKREGYEVLASRDGEGGLALARERHPDLILLDVMLPGMTGYEVCQAIRGDGMRTPVIMLTARHEEFDKVLGFDMGTDDYVTKPFSIKELMARVRAVLRRAYGEEEFATRFSFGTFTLDVESRVLTRNGVEVPLTRTEFELLSYFLRNRGRALNREDLMSDVWGTNYIGTQRSLDSFVSCLRKKVEDRPSDPQFIVTVHGVGYKFAGADE